MPRRLVRLLGARSLRNHMSKFQITLIRPQGYLHTEAFREAAETLQFGFETSAIPRRYRKTSSIPAGPTILLAPTCLLRTI